MKALQDLENAASGDAAVRQKIASLPQEVQDVSLLDKITGKSWNTLQICFQPLLLIVFYNTLLAALPFYPSGTVRQS